MYFIVFLSKTSTCAYEMILSLVSASFRLCFEHFELSEDNSTFTIYQYKHELPKMGSGIIVNDRKLN